MSLLTSSPDVIPYVIVSGINRFKVYGHPYTIYTSIPKINRIPFSMYITSRYITIDLGSLPFHPRAFMWVWERLNRLPDEEGVKYNNDEILSMWMYLHHLGVPQGDQIDRLYKMDMSTKLTPPLTDQQLATLREIGRLQEYIPLLSPEGALGTFSTVYLNLLPLEERKLTVPPSLKLWTTKISGLLDKKIPSRVGPDGNYLYFIVPHADHYYVFPPRNLDDQDVNDQDFFSKSLEQAHDIIVVSEHLSIGRDSKDRWILFEGKERHVAQYVSYFYSRTEIPFGGDDWNTTRIVPVDIINEVWSHNAIRGRRFVVGDSKIPMFGSLTIMATRSEYFSSITEYGSQEVVPIMTDFHLENLESFYYVWSYLNGFYESGDAWGKELPVGIRTEPSWEVLVGAWQYIVYFHIPFSKSFLDGYLTQLLLKAVIVGKDSLPFLMSLLGTEGRGTVPREALNKTSLYESKDFACSADEILTEIRRFTPSEIIQTPQYNKWVRTDHPHLVKGDGADIMVIWNVYDNEGRSLMTGFPYFIEGEFFKRPLDGEYPGMRTMTIMTQPLGDDAINSDHARYFHHSMPLRQGGDCFITFIIDDGNKVTIDVYENTHLGGPYNVTTTFITQRK